VISEAVERTRADVVSLPGGDFHYLRVDPAEPRPDAPLVLCLHGFPDHAEGLAPLMLDLAAHGYACVAPWMRGYAPSVREGPYDVDRLARDVLELADALSPDRPVAIVGHDWGAAATYAACALAPTRIAAATTIAAGSPDAYVLDDAARDRLHQCLHTSLPAPIEYYRAMTRPVRPALARLRGRTSVAEPIEVPTLHLQGEDDGCIAPSACAGQERFFAGPFRSVTVHHAGHWVHLDQRAETARLVADFLACHGRRLDAAA
jgi:pimeloyl-ACP methyl ester carboxylesterase